jgi:hypothetical protein
MRIVSKAQRIADEINVLNPSQLYELAHELVKRHAETADNFDMMIRSEFQDQALAKVEREARRAKMAKAVANDIFGV